jgi:hypothetical protein
MDPAAEIVNNLLMNEDEEVKKKYLEIYEKYKDRINSKDLRLDKNKIKTEQGKVIGLLYLVYDLLGYGSKAVSLIKQYGKAYVIKYAVALKKKIPEEFRLDYAGIKEKIIRYAKNLLNEVNMSEELKEKVLKEIENTKIDMDTAIASPQSYAVYLIYNAEKKTGRMEVYPSELCEKAKLATRIVYYYSKKFNRGVG